jgi:hypothetical protein
MTCLTRYSPRAMVGDTGLSMPASPDGGVSAAGASTLAVSPNATSGSPSETAVSAVAGLSGAMSIGGVPMGVSATASGPARSIELVVSASKLSIRALIALSATLVSRVASLLLELLLQAPQPRMAATSKTLFFVELVIIISIPSDRSQMLEQPHLRQVRCGYPAQ